MNNSFQEVANITKKEIITVILTVLAITVFIGFNVAFGGGTTDTTGGTGGGISRCH